MPFEPLVKSQMNIGRFQAAASRENPFHLSNKDRLKLSEASARNLISATMDKNRRKKKDKEVEELTKKVLDAANGKPSKVSYTKLKREQEGMGAVVRQLLMSILQQGQGEGSQPVQKEGNIGAKSSSNGGGVSKPEASTGSSEGSTSIPNTSIDALTSAIEGLAGHFKSQEKPIDV